MLGPREVGVNMKRLRVQRQTSQQPIRAGRYLLHGFSIYAGASRLTLIRSVSTCARSYCACCTSQLSALPPNTLDSRTAISGEIHRLPFTNSDSVKRENTSF